MVKLALFVVLALCLVLNEAQASSLTYDKGLIIFIAIIIIYINLLSLLLLAVLFSPTASTNRPLLHGHTFG